MIMVITVTEEKEIKDCQIKLSNILKEQLPKEGTYPIGSPGRTERFDLNHNDKIWWCYDIWIKGSEPIHTNRFGSLPLFRNRTNSIDLLINTPLKGINRRFKGVFAKDMERNEYIILHRGGFSRRSRDSFNNWYKGKKFEVDDGDRKEILFYVANLNKPELLVAEITNFLNEVIKFKNAVPTKK